MGRSITFKVPTIPVAQPRQRHRVISSGGRSFATNYTPKNDPVNAYKAAVQFAAQQAYDGPPLDGPLILTALFVFPRPKSLCWKSKPMLRRYHTSRPDADNLQKSTADALNGLLFVDDSQICIATIHKFIAAGDEQAHCEITVTELGP